MIHVHLANLQADVVVALSRLLGRPVYVKVACGGIGGEVLRLGRVAWATRWYGLRHADVVQALSAEIEAELESIGVDRARVRRLPNGVDLAGFLPASLDERVALRVALDLPKDVTICLYTGRFATYKGLADLLAVWDSQSSPAVLVLVGSADTDRPMAPIQSDERLIVRDWSNRVVDYLRAADVFVYPSYADGMSNAVMEAMACGLAVVASRSGATEDIAVDGRSASLFDAGDQAGLASALAAVLASPGRRGELGGEARESIERFDIRRVVSEIEENYRLLTVTA